MRLLRLRTVRRRIVVNVLAAVGGVLTFGSVVGLVVSDAAWLAWTQVGLLVVGVTLAIRASLPPREVELIHPGTRTRVWICRGDLLDVEGEPVVVTLNRHLDVAAADLSSRSLVRQVVHRWFADDEAPLRAALAIPDGQPGRDEEVAVGTAVDLVSGSRQLILLAMARRDPEARSSVVVNDVWMALSALWAHARQHGYERINMPVIGAGMSNARIGDTSLLMLLIASLLATGHEHYGVCPVRVMLHGDPGEAIGLMELAVDFCHKLGFR